MTAFTRVGCSIWDWEPWTELSPNARLFWWALYTTAEAKRHPPGLWHGGLPTMADAARMRPDDVRDGLDELLDHDVVEYDPKTRVLRLCVLPDAGEYPSNGKVILGWWTKFQTVPACAVRDAHVRTLRWILDEGAQRACKIITPHHEEAWSTTFAKVTIPAPRRRGIRRLADSDTSTGAQPSLFPTSSQITPTPAQRALTHGDGGYPQVCLPPVDNSASVRQLNNFNIRETVSDTVSDTNRIPDPGSRIPDLLSSSGEGGWGGGHGSSIGIKLAVVPDYGWPQVANALGACYDPAFDELHQEALDGVLPAWQACRVDLAGLALLGQTNATSSTRINAIWVVRNHTHVPDLIARAKKFLQDRDDRLAMLREFKLP